MSIINVNSSIGTYYGIKQNVKRFSGLAMNAKGGFSFKEEALKGGFVNLANPEEFERKWMKVEKENQRMEAYRKMKSAHAATAKQISEMEAELGNSSAEKEAENKTEIIVKPDGSRVLVVTMNFGGMETTMSIEISKPTDFPNDNSKQGDDNDSTAASETETALNEI